MTGSYVYQFLEAALCLLWMILCGFSIFCLVGAFAQRLPVNLRAVIGAQFLFEYLIFQDITSRDLAGGTEQPAAYAPMVFFFVLSATGVISRIVND